MWCQVRQGFSLLQETDGCRGGWTSVVSTTRACRHGPSGHRDTVTVVIIRWRVTMRLLDERTQLLAIE